MSRLTKRNNKGYVGIKGYHGLLTSYCYECTEELEDGVYLLEDALNKLAEYEDLEEQGLLLRLPCKVGDTVYAPLPNNEISAWKVRTIDMGASYFDFLLVYAGDDEEFIGERFLLPINDIGENVFLTREEAEQKLKEMESGKDKT